MTRKSSSFKLVCSFISGAVIATSFTALCWQQISYNNLMEMNKSAHTAIHEIDKLLGEASQAINMTSALTPRNCSASMRRRLSKIAIGIEHVRVINIYRDDVLVCSSYDTESRGAPRPNFSNVRLEILRNAYFTNGTTVIVLRDMSDGYLITSSMSTQWSASILNMLSESNGLSLRIGNVILNRDNKLSTYGGTSINTTQIRSELYPYSIVFSTRNKNSLYWYLRNGWLSLFLALTIGVLGGILTWIILFRDKTLYEKLEVAIKNGDIHPWYQPIYNYSTGQIIGVEVLARWIKSKGQILLPSEFIPLAEKTSLIINLTRSIMNKSIQDLSELVPANNMWTVGINFTREHLSEPGFVTECINYIDSFKNKNIALVVELTEREPFDDSELLVNRIKALHSNGIKIALDDFGTGYANLSYINKLCVDVVKIDRSFVSKFDSAASGQLLEDIINLSQNLNLKIVAEGVETLEQAEWLNHRGVIMQQGYFYSPAISLDKLSELIKKER